MILELNGDQYGFAMIFVVQTAFRQPPSDHKNHLEMFLRAKAGKGINWLVIMLGWPSTHTASL